MRTRIRPSEPMVSAILSGIRCPQALVLARDGLFKGANLPKAPLFSVAWSVVVTLAYHVLALFNGIRYLGQRPMRPEIPSKKTTLASKVAFLYLLLQRRLAARRSMHIVHIASGGHHLHLTDPENVMASLRPWLQASGGGIRCAVANDLWQ